MSKEKLILTNCRNKAMLVLEMLELALKLEGEQQGDAIAAAQKGFAELNERMLKITPKEPRMYDPKANDKPRKRICYQIFNSRGDLILATWDEDHRDERLNRLNADNDAIESANLRENYATGEVIVNVSEAHAFALTKLTALDKLVLGMSDEPKPKPVTR